MTSARGRHAAAIPGRLRGRQGRDARRAWVREGHDSGGSEAGDRDAEVYYWIKSLTIRFEVTTQRVRVERGLFSKMKDNIELFGIEHFDIHKPLGMRLVGHCQLHLRSSDESAPSVLLYGIPDLESLADTLRECSLRERKRRGVTTWVDA